MIWEHNFRTIRASGAGQEWIAIRRWIERMKPCGWHLADVVYPVFWPTREQDKQPLPKEWEKTLSGEKPGNGPYSLVILKREVGPAYKERCVPFDDDLREEENFDEDL